MTLTDLLALVESDLELRGLASLRTWRSQVRPLVALLGGCARLSPADLERYIRRRRGAGAAPATINRELAALRRGYALARRADPSVEIPYVPRLEEHNARQGFVTPETYTRLSRALRELDRPTWGVVEMLWGLGRRLAEIRLLTWAEVDGQSLRLRSDRVKNRRATAIPLTTGLQAIARERWEGRDGALVFHRRGRPLDPHLRPYWRRACEKAGAKGLLIHDLRRSFAKRLRDAGVPESTVMAIGGWRSAAVFRRYAIVDEVSMARALESPSPGGPGGSASSGSPPTA